MDDKDVNIEEKNKENLIKFVERFWEFNTESLEFLKKRISQPSTEFVPEYASLLKGSTDQRVRWDVDMTDSSIQEFFKVKDEAFSMFKRKFENAICFLANQYSTKIGYSNFMSNKVVFKKNEMKLKKVLETAYIESATVFNADARKPNTKENIEEYILKTFESIGTLKKPNKKIQLVLSFNICDWLLASTGGNISSCLNLEGGGHRFWSGLPFMAGDPNRAMLYITDGSKKTYEGFTVDNCATRSWVILTETGRKAIIRWYSSNILTDDAICSIAEDSNFKMGMNASGKYEITPLFLKSGVCNTIYLDEGVWIKGGKNNDKIIHSTKDKGCFQVLNESLSGVKTDFTRPQIYQHNEWKISLFKQYGVSVNDFVPVSRCSSCGERKLPVKISHGSEPVCYKCFSKNYYECDSCGGTHNINEKHFEGVVFDGNGRFIKKICNSCMSKIKKCACCDTPIINGALSVVEGGYICPTCLEIKTNGYKKCSTCGKISKKRVSSYYNYEKKKLIEYCDEHKINEGKDIETNAKTFTIYIRIPAETLGECQTCNSRVPHSILFAGKCPSCVATVSEPFEV